MIVRFGDFEFDRGRGTVTGPAGPVNLRPQTFRLLETLLEHAPDLVDRDSLLDEVWGHEYLSPNVLPQAISELRQALGDNAQTPRYIQTVHRRGYRVICPVEMIRQAPSTSPKPHHLLSPQPAAPATRRGMVAWVLATVFALGLVLVGSLTLSERPESSPDSSRPTGEHRAIVALTIFPGQDEVPEWVAPAALELMTRLLANDDRVLVLRGENLGLDVLPPGARWQHAMRDLLGAPVAITGHWRMSGDELRLDYNLIELDSGRQIHGGQLPGSITALDSLIAQVADDLRAALELPATSVPGQWHAITPEQRRAYWQALAELGRSNYPAAAEQLESLYEELHQPAWLAPVAARALRLSGQPAAARRILTAAMDAPDTLRGLGASLRLRAELARLEHDPAQAAAALRALTALFPDEADLLLELATAELDGLDGESARRTITRLQAHRLLGHHPRLKLLRARLARLDGKNDRAVTLAKSALTDAENHQLPELAVQSILTLVDISQARAELNQAAELLSDFSAQWHGMLSPDQAFSIELRQVALDRMRGQFTMAQQRLDRISGEPRNETRHLETIVERALIESEKGQFAAASDTLAAIESRIHALAEPRLGVAFFSARARIAAEQGRAEDARADFGQAFDIARRTGQAHHLAGLQVNAGLMLARQRRFDEADRLWQEALSVFEQIGDTRGRALCLSNLAASAAARGLDQRADELNQQALDLFRQLDMNSHVARTSYNLGLLARRQGRFHHAAELFEEASRNYLAGGSHSLAVAAGTRQADTLVALGRYDLAQETLERLEQYRDQATALHQADWHATRARLLRWTGDLDSALDELDQATELRRESGSPEWLAVSQLQRLEIDLLSGASAADILFQSERQLHRINTLNQPRLHAQALAMVAEALLVQGRHDEARIQLREARAALTGMPDALVDIRLDWLEAWAADETERSQRLQELAERVRGMDLDSHLLLIQLALDPSTLDSANDSPLLLPVYATHHSW
jgi:DNA-binding winged helix-turn-helix (wHTH) protein/tetratricopeptide (TPR) repeat protein